MQGNLQIIQKLNQVLGNHLIAINQYFLHARMYEDWGLDNIGKLVYKQSIRQMKHADVLIKRILFLEGLPNLQDLGRLKIGEHTSEMLTSDLNLQLNLVDSLRNAIIICEQNGDFISRKSLREILNYEEDYVDFLETQINLIKQISIENYLQSQINSEE